jgi:hypothetical protein
LNLLIGIFTDGAYVTGYGKWRFQGTWATQCPGV